MNGNFPHLLFDVRIHYYHVDYDDDDDDDDVMKSGNIFFLVDEIEKDENLMNKLFVQPLTYTKPKKSLSSQPLSIIECK